MATVARCALFCAHCRTHSVRVLFLSCTYPVLAICCTFAGRWRSDAIEHAVRFAQHATSAESHMLITCTQTGVAHCLRSQWQCRGWRGTEAKAQKQLVPRLEARVCTVCRAATQVALHCRWAHALCKPRHLQAPAVQINGGRTGPDMVGVFHHSK
jgi:hypothetical protein